MNSNLRLFLSLALVANLSLANVACNDSTAQTVSTASPLSPAIDAEDLDSSKLPVNISGHLFDGLYSSDCPDGEKDADFRCTGIYPLQSALAGNQIALLTNGEASLRARIQTIKDAKETIDIQALVFRGDESGLYIANLLRIKQQEGVRIRILMDAASNYEHESWWMFTDLLVDHNEDGSMLKPIYVKGYAEVLSDIAEGNPEDINKRFHDKLWIVDGETDHGVAIAGGLNIANEYFRVDTETPKNLWRDQDVIVRGPIVKDLLKGFEEGNNAFLEDQKEKSFGKLQDWLIKLVDKGTQAGKKVPAPKLFFRKQFKKIKDADATFSFSGDVNGVSRTMDLPFPISKRVMDKVKELADQPLPLEQMFRDADMRFVHSRPRLGQAYIRDAYIERLDSARSQVLIANAYFVPTKEILAAIKRTARRGVDVRIITNSFETNDLPDLSLAGRSMYAELLEAGARVYEWHADKFGQGTIHAKYAVFDRESAIVGSYNLDPRSEVLNSETVMAFENVELASELADFYTQKDLPFAEEVTPELAQTYLNDVKHKDAKIRLRARIALKLKHLL